MQLIGIYLGTHKNPVSKNLKENWYPFGNFDNCHGVKDFSNILKQVKENQTFINKFYNVGQESGENKPSINLSCIVGKNGSGKSSVLSLLYRIINNLACKLKEVLSNFNKDYSPMWAWGFNAELYYEMDGYLGCIEIFDNDEPSYTEKRVKNLPVRLVIYPKKEDLLSRKPKKTEEKEFLEKLGESIFYTIGTNYSLYTNSVVRFNYDESQESWMSTIYHKNDGYFTPIVLVPYRNYNGKNSIIDTEKELRLANERVNTLAILLRASDGSAFIEGFMPEKVVFELKNGKICRNEIKNKIKKLYSNDDENKTDCEDFDKTVAELKDFIGREWKNRFKDKKILNTDISNLKNEKLKNIIFNNILCYLSYKTIKICIYYDRYKKLFKETGIFYDYENHKEDCKNKIKNIILRIYNNKESTDFINLKIKQCIEFLRNGAFYLEKIGDENGISIERIIDEIENKNGKNLTYDSVFLKLLPPVFKKKYVYKKIGSDEEMTISQMSSGEQQLLYSLSYAVYHMKNAASNRKGNNLISIPYKNMNLIFDEAELYYHPEYQRQFIDKLLGILKRSHFEEDIDSINITIVTHSPFMLSDIPNSNILALKDGKHDTSFESKTLGANIYDLLSNQFFMESAIGAHVEKIINEIIDDYNKFKSENYESKEKYDNKDDAKFYVKFAQEIGDEYLRDVIQDMISLMQGKDYRERKIESYNRKIKQLENKK